MKVKRQPPRDILIGEDSALLLYPDELMKVSGIGTVIVQLSTDPISVTDLAQALEQLFGRPGGVSTLTATRAAVDELVDRGVLQVVTH